MIPKFFNQKIWNTIWNGEKVRTKAAHNHVHGSLRQTSRLAPRETERDREERDREREKEK